MTHLFRISRTLESRESLVVARVMIAAAILLAASQVILAQQSMLGTNLIVNGGAEAGPGSSSLATVVKTIPGWTAGTGTVNVLSYDITNYLLSTSPSPPDRGFQYFASGTTSPSTLTQDIDVSSLASVINTGNIKFTASAYIGGSGQLANLEFGKTQVVVAFKNANGQTFNTITLGPFQYSGSLLSLQQQIGLVPVGTAKVTITISLMGFNGDLGAADSLSLVFTSLATSPGPLLGRNLVANSGAESGPSAPYPTVAQYIPGWSTAGVISVAPYGGNGWLGPADPGPADRGVSVFCGPGSSYQDVDVSGAASLIDLAQVTYQISAWLGGTDTNNGSASAASTLTYTFYDWTGKQLATTGQLGPIGNGLTGLYELAHAETLPVGTRRVRIALSLPSNPFVGGGVNMADAISFILATPSGPPVLDPAGVVSASAFGGSTSVAAGSWIEIYGRNFAKSAASWSGDDFVNGVAPTSLGGVTVSVGGQAAFIDYVSPGQVNALLPYNVPAGPMPVTITNSNGTSDPYYVYVNQTQPSLLAPALFKIGGLQYVAAFLPDGQTFALPTNSVFGVTSAPAKPGQTIVIYGVGFGPVSDGVTAGTLATQQDALSTPLIVMFGNTQAQLAYAGLALTYTGLYQINVVVPQIANNNSVPISISLGGVAGTQKLYIAVQN